MPRLYHRNRPPMYAWGRCAYCGSPEDCCCDDPSDRERRDRAMRRLPRYSVIATAVSTGKSARLEFRQYGQHNDAFALFRMFRDTPEHFTAVRLIRVMPDYVQGDHDVVVCSYTRGGA